MISYKNALQVMESSVRPPATEIVNLPDALNRVLARELFSDVDMPPFDKAAMDGYACRRADLGNELSVIEEIPAGKVPGASIGINQCARIMTGAMLPEGADYIFMKEYAEIKDRTRVNCIQHGDNTNICYKGEDIKSGDLILMPGTKLLPAQLAMLAAGGCVRPEVYKLPEIAVISTGDELVEPDIKPADGKIRNSNGLQLTAQVRQLGIPVHYLGIVRDNREALLQKVAGALENYQLVLISGGVSVGDYDFVPLIVRELQMEILIQGMNVKPGKHLLFSKKGDHFVAGMPGNPVSSFVLFEIFVKPLLQLIMGGTGRQVRISVPLAVGYYRKISEALAFIPVLLTVEGTAQPLEYHGSAHINAYAGANGIMEVPAGVNEIKAGEIVNVRPL